MLDRYQAACIQTSFQCLFGNSTVVSTLRLRNLGSAILQVAQVLLAMLSLHDKFQLGYLRSDSEFYKYMACYLVGGLPIATHPLSATMPLTNKLETFALEGSKGLGT